MAEARRSAPAQGFSLVEMMVAMVFVLILMAGMSSVFKASLSSFFTSGESVSSNRRNRMSIDLLVADLNTACTFLSDLTNPPNYLVPANPPFCVLPNMLNTVAPAGTPNWCDELYFVLDQAPPFDGVLQPIAGQQSAAQQVAAGPANQNVANNIFSMECGSATNALQVAVGQNVFFKDSGTTGYIIASQVMPGNAGKSMVQVTLGPDPLAGLKGTGPVGVISASHISPSAVVFFQPAQVIKYSVQLLRLDPNPANPLMPCLVRDQGNYSAQNANYANFVTNQPQQIVTENVQGFKVYLSVSSPNPTTPNVPQLWAGKDLDPTIPTSAGWSGWTTGLLAVDANSINTQVGAVAPNVSSITLPVNNPNWFRSIPTLVRLDITTRTTTQRTEYSANPTATTPTAAYKTQTQSMVIVPRQSGLSMDNS